MKRILCISDLHCPANHPDTLPFLDAIKKKYQPDRIILMGDEIDGHTISFHTRNPDYPLSPSGELQAAIKTIKEVYTLFPKADVLDSNHGSLIYRLAQDRGIPSSCLKPWSQVLGTPGWKWHRQLVLTLPNGKRIAFHHGKSSAFMRWANAVGCSTVESHYHTKFGVVYNGEKFSLKVGCMIDDEQLNFNYNKTTADEPMLGHAIILDGMPVPLPMRLTLKGLWIGRL